MVIVSNVVGSSTKMKERRFTMSNNEMTEKEMLVQIQCPFKGDLARCTTCKLSALVRLLEDQKGDTSTHEKYLREKVWPMALQTLKEAIFPLWQEMGLNTSNLSKDQLRLQLLVADAIRVFLTHEVEKKVGLELVEEQEFQVEWVML